MKRALNFRLMTFMAVALCAGVAIGGLIYGSILLSVLIPTVSFAVGILLSFLFKTKKMIVLLLFFTFSLGVSVFVTSIAISRPKLSGEQTLLLRVEQVSERSDNVILSGDGIGTISLSGKNDLKEGDLVAFYGTLTPVEFSYADSRERYLFTKGISYTAKAEAITVTDNAPSVFQKIRVKSRNIMLRYMDKEDAAVCMSLVFGDKSTLSSKTADETAGAGLAHVFAVSGLHVGFLAAIISYLLKKCRVLPVPRLIVTVSVLLLYGILTGFPAGIKRAVIMFFIYEFAVIVARKKDSLVTLSAAVFLIVLTDPKELFDIGFLMSAGSVAGIVLFYRPLYSVVSKMPYGIAKRLLMYPYGLLCVTLSANVFTLPLSFSAFGVFTPYAVVGNLLVLPVLSVVFPMLFVAVALSLIFNGFGILFYVIKYPIIAIRLFSSLVSSWPGAQMEASGLGLAAVFYVLFFIVAGRFLTIDKKFKIPACGALALSAVLTVLFL